MKKEPFLKMTGIRKSFSTVNVLKGVDLEAYKGEVLALLGTNGAGKSTLMNVLGGIYKQDEGDIVIGGEKVHFVSPADAARAGIAFVQQEMTLMPTMSIMDNLFINNYEKNLGFINYKSLYGKCKIALARLGCNYDPNTIVGDLGAGDRQLVQITRSLLSNPQIVIFDEATSSLTPREKEKLFKVVRGLCDEKVTVIYITHMMDEISEICDRLMVLRDGICSGKVKVAGLIREVLVDMMIGDKASELAVSHKEQKDLSDKPVYMRVKGLEEKGVLEDISFQVRSGEVVGFWGLLGAGRTELVRAICGLDPIDSGTVEINDEGRLVKVLPKKLLKEVAFVTEDRRVDGLALELTVRENMNSANLRNLTGKTCLLMDTQREKEICNQYVDELSIKISSIDQPIRTLSGGNQQKVILGRWLQKHPDIYIFDEPTRGLDIGAKADIMRIINQLSSEGAAVIVISSDIDEIMSVSHRYLVMHGGRIFKELPYSATKEQLMAAAVGVELGGEKREEK